MKMLLRQATMETKLFLRRKDELFWTLAFPVFFIVLFGSIYGDTMWEEFGIRAVNYILPGIMVMAMMTTGLMTTASAFAEDRDRGIYRRLALTPLKRQTILGAQILQRYLLILVQALLLLGIGEAAFKVEITGNLFLFWLVLSVGALVFLSIGFSLTGLMKSGRSGNPITMTAFFILMFLGGLFFPTTMMPGFMQGFAGALPSTHLNNALREVTMNGAGLGAIWQDLLISVAWLVGCLGVAVKFFRWE